MKTINDIKKGDTINGVFNVKLSDDQNGYTRCTLSTNSESYFQYLPFNVLYESPIFPKYNDEDMITAIDTMNNLLDIENIPVYSIDELIKLFPKYNALIISIKDTSKLFSNSNNYNIKFMEGISYNDKFIPTYCSNSNKNFLVLFENNQIKDYKNFAIKKYY